MESLTRRWSVVIGRYDGMERRAADLVYASLKRFTDYIPVMKKTFSEEENVLLVGTPESNPVIRAALTEPLPPDGTLVMVTTAESGAQRVLIAGGSASACYYAAVEFADDYLTGVRRNKSGNPFFKDPFASPLPEYERRSVPTVKERGLWTWGHVIYDFEGYLSNMARLKLNRVTVWNDFPPVNAKEFVDHAHSLGIKVIWGYSWGWDEKPDIGDPACAAAWSERVLKLYREAYADTGCDGLYFQTFTETSEETINGQNRAAAAVKWVNAIAAKLLDAYPDLSVEFGLHATGVKRHLDEIARTDPRLSITWEDCGAFPYAYDARDTNGQDETMRFTKEIASLRDGNGFGAVFKGQSWLDWSVFRHHEGPHPIGVASEQEIEEKTPCRRNVMRFQNSFWAENGPFALEIVREIVRRTDGNAALEVLLEDSLFDRHLWSAAALFAEMLWSCEEPFERLYGRVARRENVE